MTRYGKSILDLVNQANAHLTAEKVFFAMREIYPNIAMATVYNNLNALCEQGLIRRLSVEGCPDVYDRSAPHDHLVCRRCGKLSDITLEDMTGRIEADLGFPIESYDLKVYWLCDDCRGAQ